MKAARIENGVAVEVIDIADGFTIEESIHPDFAELYSEVPDFVVAGATLSDDGEWTNPSDPDPQPEMPAMPPIVTHGEFRALFTLKERTAIRKDSVTDEGVAECYAFMNDSPPPQVDLGSISTIEILDYLIEYGILTESRKAEILTGTPR